MVVTVINMRNGAQGGRMTVNHNTSMGCNLSFAKEEWWVLLSKYAPPALNIFDTGVTQASISFKNDCKISQSSAEFETHAIDSYLKWIRMGTDLLVMTFKAHPAAF